MRVRVLAVLLLAALLTSCGTTHSTPTVTNPLQEMAGTPVVATPSVAGVPPPLPGPGSAIEAEGAAVRALEFLTEQTGLSPSEFRLLAVQATSWPDRCLGIAPDARRCAPGPVEGWKVVLTDFRGGAHTLHITAQDIEWAGEAQLRGRVVTVDADQRTVTLETATGARTLRLALPRSARATLPLPEAGRTYLVGYDASPLADGVPLVAWLFEVAP